MEEVRSVKESQQEEGQNPGGRIGGGFERGRERVN
jgi:hypothetical protein